MISRLDNGSVLAVLGEGTLYTSVVTSEGKPVGVSFTSKSNGTFGENDIILQLTTIQAVTSYVDTIFRFISLVAEDNGEGAVVDELEKVRKSIQKYMPKEKASEEKQ